MRISVFVFSVMRDSYHAGGGKHHMGNCCSFWLLMPQRKMYIYDSGAEPGSQPGSCKTQSKLNIWVQYLVLFLIYGWNVRSQQRREVTDKSKALGDGNKWITPKFHQVRSVSGPCLIHHGSRAEVHSKLRVYFHWFCCIVYLFHPSIWITAQQFSTE